ncbi:hypothetical protein KC734_22190 [candidate division KSB1 bacterium]|nr:hypothetical protein [candidate division KSB1 bacterium]
MVKYEHLPKFSFQEQAWQWLQKKLEPGMRAFDSEFVTVPEDEIITASKARHLGHTIDVPARLSHDLKKSPKIPIQFFRKGPANFILTLRRIIPILSAFVI